MVSNGELLTPFFAGLVVVALAHGFVLRADSASVRRIQFAVTVAGSAGSGETYGGFSRHQVPEAGSISTWANGSL